MRAACALVLIASLGCSNTVRRLDGEVRTPVGPARTDCEKRAWLVLAPTRYEEVQDDGRTTRAKKDGIGLYRVGAEEPVSIPDAAGDLGPSPLVDAHTEGVREYDRDRTLAAALGVGGLILISLGTGLFITSFETTRTSSGEEEQRINGKRATWAAVSVGAGFGLGVAGIVINPSYSERARAENTRYVFVPPEDDEHEVRELVARHNSKVRQSCRRIERGTAADDGEAAEESEELDSEEPDTEGEDESEAPEDSEDSDDRDEY